MLVFLGGLGLRLISGREIVRLSFFFIFGSFIVGLLIRVFFVFLDQRAMALWAPGIDLPNIEKWL